MIWRVSYLVPPRQLPTSIDAKTIRDMARTDNKQDEGEESAHTLELLTQMR